MSERAHPHQRVSQAPIERAAGPSAPPREVEAPHEPGPAAALEAPWGRVAQFAIVGLALFVVGWLLWRARAALVPFAFGLVLAYVRMPLVDRLDKGMPRPLARAWASTQRS